MPGEGLLLADSLFLHSIADTVMAETGQQLSPPLRVSHRRRNLAVIIFLFLLGIVLATYAPAVSVPVLVRYPNGSLRDMHAQGSLTYAVFHCGMVYYQVPNPGNLWICG